MKQIVISLIIMLISMCNVFAEIEVMPLSDIKPGMRGVGKTVFRDMEVEDFDVEVLDIIRNFAPKIDVILVRLIGEKIEKTGVISGMSGSPVYIDGKLIGALAYSFGIFQKEPFAGITPIGSMFEIVNKESIREKEAASVSTANQELSDKFLCAAPDEQISLFSEMIESTFQKDENISQLSPITIPIVCSGIHPNILKRISPSLEPAGFRLVQGGASSSSIEKTNAPLKPGDAVAGAIISGDYNVAATGTVTYCEGNRVLAFGHPFFNSGPVNIPMARVKILTILSSMMHSTKFSSVGEVIGNIRQDRFSGIMGVLGEESPMIPIEIDYSTPFENKKIYRYSIAKDQTLNFITPTFFWLTILSTLESARFSNGDYSIQLDGKFILKNDSDIIINNFYPGTNFSDPPGSGQDIMQVAYDIVMRLIPLMLNEYKYPDIEKIQLSFRATPGKRGLIIENVWYDKSEIQPGDDLNINIQLRAYQGNLVNINRQVKVPANITSNRIIITVGSAQYMTMWDRRFAPAKFRPQNFDELVDILNNTKKNNVLYIQLKALEKGAIIGGKELPNLPPTILNILTEKKTKGDFNNLREFVLKEFEVPMEYGIYGGKSIQLKVKD